MHPKPSSCQLGCAWTEVCYQGHCLCNPSLLHETNYCRHPAWLAWANLFVALLFIFACLWVEGASQGETLWSQATIKKKDSKPATKGVGAQAGQEGAGKSKAAQGGGAPARKVDIFVRIAILSRSALSVGSYAALLCAVLYSFTPFLPLRVMRLMMLVLAFLSLLVTIPQGLAVLFTVLSFLKMCHQSSIISSRARSFFSVLSITGIALTESLSVAQRLLLITRPSLLEVLKRQLICLAMQQTLLACTGLPPLLALCRRRVAPDPEANHSPRRGGSEGDVTATSPIMANSPTGAASLSSSLRNSPRKPPIKPAARSPLSKNGPHATSTSSPKSSSPGGVRNRLVRKATERLSRLLLATLAATAATTLCVLLVMFLPHRVPALPALYAFGGCFLVFMDSVQEMHGRGSRPGSSSRKWRQKKVGKNGREEGEKGGRASKPHYAWSSHGDTGGSKYARGRGPLAGGKSPLAAGDRPAGGARGEEEEEEDYRLSTIAEASREFSSTSRMSASYNKQAPPGSGFNNARGGPAAAASQHGDRKSQSGSSGNHHHSSNPGDGPPSQRPWDRSNNEFGVSGGHNEDGRRSSSSASTSAPRLSNLNQARDSSSTPPPVISVAPNDASTPFRSSPPPVPEEADEEEGGYGEDHQDRDGRFYGHAMNESLSSIRSSRTSSSEDMSVSGDTNTSETVRLEQFADLLQDNIEAYL